MTYLPITLITLFAFFLRWHGIDMLIPRHIDELQSIQSIVEVWDNPHVSLLMPHEGVPAFSRIYTALQIASVDVLGANLAGLRLVSVFFGTLTIPALYLLAKRWFDIKTALIAALILATFPPHIHFSRIGLNNIVDPFFGTMAFALAPMLIGGIALGGTAYFYEGGRLIFSPLFLLTRWKIKSLITAIVVMLPLYATWIINDLPLFPRLEETRGNGFDILPPLKFLFIEPETSWFYAGDTPLILFPLIPLFIIGAWRAMKSRDGRFLLIWVTAVIIGNGFLDEVQSPRYVAMFPALALILALGIIRYHRVIVVIICLMHVGYYFLIHAPQFVTDSPEQIILDDIRFRAKDLPDGTAVHVLTTIPIMTPDFYYYMRFVNRHDDNVFFAFYYPEEYTVNDIHLAFNTAIFFPPEQIPPMIESFGLPIIGSDFDVGYWMVLIPR